MRKEPPTESELFPSQEALHIPVSEAPKILTSFAYPRWRKSDYNLTLLCALGLGFAREGMKRAILKNQKIGPFAL